MDSVLEFARAALPWVAMGLLLVILFVRNTGKKKKDPKGDADYGLEGMCVGMCFGTAIGTAAGNNTGLGITLGMLAGLAIGSVFHKNSKNKAE